MGLKSEKDDNGEDGFKFPENPIEEKRGYSLFFKDLIKQNSAPADSKKEDKDRLRGFTKVNALLYEFEDEGSEYSLNDLRSHGSDRVKPKQKDNGEF